MFLAYPFSETSCLGMLEIKVAYYQTLDYLILLEIKLFASRRVDLNSWIEMSLFCSVNVTLVKFSYKSYNI